ncbi:hypothetical protein FACS1894198_0830 [Clostridia bacterium]|nr:hypothetical protein FACS1894198_0830 [Clostridia bacterium]
MVSGVFGAPATFAVNEFTDSVDALLARWEKCLSKIDNCETASGESEKQDLTEAPEPQEVWDMAQTVRDAFADGRAWGGDPPKGPYEADIHPVSHWCRAASLACAGLVSKATAFNKPLGDAFARLAVEIQRGPATPEESSRRQIRQELRRRGQEQEREWEGREFPRFIAVRHGGRIVLVDEQLWSSGSVPEEITETEVVRHPGKVVLEDSWIPAEPGREAPADVDLPATNVPSALADSTLSNSLFETTNTASVDGNNMSGSSDSQPTTVGTATSTDE